MSYHSVDALVGDDDGQSAGGDDESTDGAESLGGADSTDGVEIDLGTSPQQMDISQAPEPVPGDVALPTMAELDEMVKALDEIDAMLASLDSGDDELVSVGGAVGNQPAGSST